MRPFRFRVYPAEGSRLCAVVVVYPTLKAMREGVRTLDGFDKSGHRWSKRDRDRLAGHCSGVTMRYAQTQRILPVFAEVFFSRTAMGIGTITHECVHAGLRWLARTGVEQVNTNKAGFGNVATVEETLARAVDSMAQQVVRRCRGVIA